MRNRTIGIVGLVLLVVGVCGLLVSGLLVLVSVVEYGDWFDSGRSTGNSDWESNFGRREGEFDSLGEQIYYTGVGEDGDTIERQGGFGMMASGGCVTCHGDDGRGGAFGGMMGGRLNVPDIRYETLTSPHEENGESEEAWTDDDIGIAIRTGEEPSGERLSRFMPRWDMDDNDMAALIAYLKELE